MSAAVEGLFLVHVVPTLLLYPLVGRCRVRPDTALLCGAFVLVARREGWSFRRVSSLFSDYGSPVHYSTLKRWADVYQVDQVDQKIDLRYLLKLQAALHASASAVS